MQVDIFTNDGGSLAKKRSRLLYVCAAFPIALVLFFLFGCDIGGDPAWYDFGTRYYTVTFNGNGNTTGSAPAPIKAADSSYITLPGQGSMAKSEYSFEGWYDSYDRTRYDSGSPYKIDSRSLTLYAIWMFAEVATPGEFFDVRDGQTYKSVRIGSQTWMAENLNYDTSSGSWCYRNDSSNCDTYGRLYDWYTATTICPTGWHLPSRAEWDELAEAVGGIKPSYYDESGHDWLNAGEMLRATFGWNDYNGISGNGTDGFGFSALPGGYQHFGGSFNDVGNYGYWWTATESGSSSAYSRVMYHYYGNVSEYTRDRSYGLSVRCVQN